MDADRMVRFAMDDFGVNDVADVPIWQMLEIYRGLACANAVFMGGW